MKKRVWLGILAALCMVLLLSSAAFAADSGTCGENVTWKLDGGILTISGTGAMTGAPWLNQKDQIVEVVIEEGVTTVCDGAFDGCVKLEYVTVPASVSSLGERAFAQCDELRMMFFHGDLPALGRNCFADTGATVYYPAGNETWPSGTIAKNMYCRSTDYATSGVWGDNITWKYENGVLTFSGVGEMQASDVNNLRPWMIYEAKVTKVMVEKGITKLTNNFVQWFKKLSTVSLPEGLTEISGRAFSMCTSLEEVNIPSSVTIIRDFGFDTCSSLTEIQLPDGLQKIEMDAFRHCTALESISFPGGMTLLDGTAFSYCTSLKKIYFLGDAPAAFMPYFNDVTATVYYPAGNATWTEEKRQSYAGNLTWEPYCGENHMTETVAAVAPGCTTTGLTEGKRCKYCGEVLQKQETVPATGHSFGDWEEVKAATTEETGLAERKCKNCSVTEQKTLEKLNPAETEPEPTETSPEPTETEPAGDNTKPSEDAAESATAAAEGTTPAEPDIAVKDEPKDTPWAVIVIGAVVILAGGGAAGYYFVKKKR